MRSASTIAVPLENRSESVSGARFRDAATLPSIKHHNSVLNASAWSMIGYGASQFLRLGNNMILSYLLVPEAFGTMAIINLVIVGLGMFSTIGAGPCIIQNAKGDEPSFLNTAWTLQLIRGVVIAICAGLLAWPVANFYREPALLLLIPVAALTSIIDAACSTSIFTLQRHLNLKSLAGLEIISQIAGSICMCSIAWFYPSVWALVAGAIAMTLTRTTISHFLLRDYSNRIEWNQEHARQLFRFGKWIFVSTLLAFGAMQIDRMMMGRLFDIPTLGLYSFALAIATMPQMLVEKLCMSIMYPLLSKCQRESPSKLASELQVAREVILVIGMALLISVFATCRIFFETFYHTDYHLAGEICQWLCAAAWFVMLSLTLSRALVALGNTRALASFNLARLTGSFAASLLGLRIAGFPGFIAGLAVGSALGHVAIVASLARHRIVLLRQDARLTAILAGAIMLSALFQNSSQISLPFQLVANGLLCVTFWAWAINEVIQYRSRTPVSMSS
ncbi:oligosaccharide flippase family protein [Stieleria marina]|uniref:Teichuronic acid biosynthesis protein TuaB n=1 Tax=Stieleria marina TaxID=1930275 RepID=A0A517NNV2_9BACT|nr:Teichuronic acid biosynthesis protein TuaB [Planctomycetes bacterium K23_9]